MPQMPDMTACRMMTNMMGAMSAGTMGRTRHFAGVQS